MFSLINEKYFLITTQVNSFQNSIIQIALSRLSPSTV